MQKIVVTLVLCLFVSAYALAGQHDIEHSSDQHTALCDVYYGLSAVDLPTKNGSKLESVCDANARNDSFISLMLPRESSQQHLVRAPPLS